MAFQTRQITRADLEAGKEEHAATGLLLRAGAVSSGLCAVETAGANEDGH